MREKPPRKNSSFVAKSRGIFQIIFLKNQENALDIWNILYFHLYNGKYWFRAEKTIFFFAKFHVLYLFVDTQKIWSSSKARVKLSSYCKLVKNYFLFHRKLPKFQNLRMKHLKFKPLYQSTFIPNFSSSGRTQTDVDTFLTYFKIQNIQKNS
jgi:hypothetical protein